MPSNHIECGQTDNVCTDSVETNPYVQTVQDHPCRRRKHKEAEEVGIERKGRASS